MKKQTKCILLAVAVCFCAFKAQAAAFPGLEANPKALEYARREFKGNLAWQELAELAFWASGVDIDAPLIVGTGKDKQQSSFRAYLYKQVEDFKADPLLPRDMRERAEYVLQYLYKSRILRSYSLYETELDAIVTSGRYNCVSSAVLYMIFGTAVGLDIEGVVTKDHAFATVKVGDERIDVETTNRYGFDPGNRKEFHNGFGKATGFAYVSSKNYRDRSPVSQLELISVIFTNRMTVYQMQKKYTESIQLALDRAALLSLRRNPTDSEYFLNPEADIMSRLIFYGTTLLSTRQDEAVFQWITAVGARFPLTNPKWQELRAAALNNLVGRLTGANDFSGARQNLSLYKSGVSADEHTRLLSMILDAELNDKMKRIRTLWDVQQSLDAIDAAAAGGVGFDPSRLAELRTFALAKGAEFTARAQGWTAAVAFLEAALAQYGTNEQLGKIIEGFKGNIAKDIHNAFAGAYNKKNYTEALRIIEQGLKEFPENRQLKQDLNIVQKTVVK
ncbi:hypothetical protein ACYULU_03195 [Breznakiellaceae bacterium SP9]